VKLTYVMYPITSQFRDLMYTATDIPRY